MFKCSSRIVQSKETSLWAVTVYTAQSARLCGQKQTHFHLDISTQPRRNVSYIRVVPLLMLITNSAITSSYRCLVGAAPAIAGIGDNELNMIHNRGFYIMIVTQLHQTLFYVCIKEKHVSHWPKRSHFSAEDAEREAEKISDMPVTNSVLFGEIWMKRTRGYLCSLEEGIFKHWSFNRTALVGDSAHKVCLFTISLYKSRVA